MEKEPSAIKRKAYVEVNDNSDDEPGPVWSGDKGKVGIYSGCIDDNLRFFFRKR